MTVSRNRRWILIAIFAAVAIPVVCALLWLWWPDANTLTDSAARGDLAGVRLGLRFGVNPNTPSR